ncbi:hypothetical protein QBC38DRAFT_488299 [Podospora fimiseda]|uniref:Secreted protein n=1 Tax=Podospora fimiseda TaxID=252190 RepID=A0AAN7BH00_9PEZI|nr:hypothetical protein QBC38DRAFT_488299 [Podospora fimiseda]
MAAACLAAEGLCLIRSCLAAVAAHDSAAVSGWSVSAVGDTAACVPSAAVDSGEIVTHGEDETNKYSERELIMMIELSRR